MLRIDVTIGIKEDKIEEYKKLHAKGPGFEASPIRTPERGLILYDKSRKIEIFAEN